MHRNIQRDTVYINKLINFIRSEYNLMPNSITPAKRGFYGETWKMETPGYSYFIKLDYSAVHKGIYERSFPVMEHLHNHGIDFISRIVKTTDGKLSAQFDGAVFGVFDWIDGENIETDATKIPEYQMLAKIYTVPVQGLSIPSVDYSRKSADKFFTQWNRLDDAQICTLFEKNRAKLECRAERLKSFAKLCGRDTEPLFITHGDAGGNIIINGDKYYIVDWDEPILAPPERDAWNMLCYEGKEWAGCIFHKALRDNSISYTLRSERLAYFCYYYYFFYLTEYLDNLAQLSDQHRMDLEPYFDGWADNRASYADKNFKQME